MEEDKKPNSGSSESKPEEDREKELQKGLEKIYTDKEGNLPDFTRLEGKQSSKLKSIIFGFAFFLVVLAGVTWTGLFYFSQSGGGFTGEGVQLSFITEDDLTAGASTEIIIHYRNNEAIPLASAFLSADLPDEFVILESDPAPNEDGEWPIGSIAPGTSGEIRLSGWIRSELERTLTFQSELTYKPADFSSSFEKVASHTVAVTDSVMKLAGAGPDKMTPGDEVELIYTYENTSEENLEELRFSLDGLEGFIFASAEPQPDPDSGLIWSIAELAPETTETITIKGTFSAESRGPKTLGARIGFLNEDRLITIAEAGAETEVLKSALAVNMIVNGSSESTTASFGDILNFSLNYKNEGDVNLRNVVISADLPVSPNGIIDWITLNDELDGKRVGDTLTWSRSQITDLRLLEPNEEGTIDFQVQLIKKPLADSDETNYSLEARVVAAIGRVGNISGSREVASNPININLNSNTVYKAFGRYFTDDGLPLGNGPLPPKVGEKTVYRIFWIIENSLHELTNLSMETILPQGVVHFEDKGQVDAGELSFDSSGRKATWRLNRMPTTVNRLEISFDVELSPEFEDVGRIINLTGDNRFEALDKETESVILITEQPADTSLPADDDAAGKGVVQE